MKTFFLGTHEPSWLRVAKVPLFVSRRRLARLKRLPRAGVNWALDSGGFTELNLYGEWKTTPQEYAENATMYAEEVGRLEWAAIQDWMVEPFVLAKTGKTIEQHQRLSVESLLTLRSLAPSVEWCPVVQGWSIDSYFDCVRFYEAAGVDLKAEKIVGVGSICRRQGTQEAGELLAALAAAGLRLHAFGLKTQGLRQSAGLIESADSLAWSYSARRNPPLKECTHKSCSNCLKYATRWRDKVLSRPRQSQTRLAI